MGFVVLFIIFAVLLWLGRSGSDVEETETKAKLSPEQKAKKDAEYQEQLKQADEELITVILPTINHHK